MLTLLLVDDDAVVLDLLTRLLGRYFDVITCESAEMALRVIEEQMVDVILTDFELANEDGLQLLAEVQRRFPHVRRMLTSGREPSTILPRRGVSAVERFFRKPLQALHVVTAVYEGRPSDRPHGIASGDQIPSCERRERPHARCG